MFKDGWVPPQVIAGKDISSLSAAIAANAAAVAQLTDDNKKVRKEMFLITYPYTQIYEVCISTMDYTLKIETWVH